jgi:anti-sigma B factor antagonist
LDVQQIGAVRLRGEVDMSNAHEVEAIVLRMSEAGGPVVVDLSDVTFIDSSGVRTLLRAAETERGCLILHGEQPNVGRVFDIIRLDLRWNIHRIRHDDVLDVGMSDGGAANLEV